MRKTMDAYSYVNDLQSVVVQSKDHVEKFDWTVVN